MGLTCKRKAAPLDTEPLLPYNDTAVEACWLVCNREDLAPSSGNYPVLFVSVLEQ